MSRSYRFDPEAESCGRSKPRKAYRKSSGKSTDARKPTGIDPDWAVQRMAVRIGFVVDELIRNNIIPPREKEEYVAIYNAQMVKFAPLYESDWTDAQGVVHKCSPVHYLRIVEAGLTGNILNYLEFRKKNFHAVAIVDTKEAAQEQENSVWAGDRSLSDECKSFNDLWFMMDVRVLSGMLTDEERCCLSLLLDGLSQEDIAERMSDMYACDIPRQFVRRVLIPGIQDKARKCDFRPHGEQE